MVIVCCRDDVPALKDASTEPFLSVNAANFTDTVTTSSKSSEGFDKVDSASGLASNGVNMDDIMEYLQSQDAQNVMSAGVSSPSDSVTTTLSFAALQQLASECSTIDLLSLGIDSNIPFVGSQPPTSGT